MKRRETINDNATIYNYQLIRKITPKPELMISYGIAGLLFGGFQFAMYQFSGLLYWVAALVAIIITHWIIIRLTMIRVEEEEDRKWGWRLKVPWAGYLPIQMVEHQLFRKLHGHLLWLGLCAIAACYPWATESLMISLICWHIWILAPRLLLLRTLRKARRDGLLRLDAEEITFYHR
ncbi:transposase [Paenibacillaceae bacterium]|nr:transposase [Paenibacillaceae bacterium]